MCLIGIPLKAKKRRSKIITEVSVNILWLVIGDIQKIVSFDSN